VIFPFSSFSMKSLSLLAALLAISGASVLAQESATGGQAGAPALEPAQPSGLLTPPLDNTTPGKTTGSTEMTHAEIARVSQQEVIRRQELIFRANQALDTAQRAELAMDYPIARQNYLFACEAYGSMSRATASYARAAEGLTRSDFALYDDALKIGDTKRAKDLIDEVIKYNPNNGEAQHRELAINRALANPNDTSLYGNVAITPGFVDRVNEVQNLFIEAEQFRRTGQWDEAEARLKRILGIDPYNIGATKELERIDAQKMDYAEHARQETRTERLRQVEEKWYEPINNKEIATSAQEAQPAIIAKTNFSIDQKLSSIFLPGVDFTGASIEDATGFLSSESKRLDPEHKGVNFIIQPEASTSAKPITLTLTNVPLGEALRYICQLAGVKDKIEDYAISIVPFNANTDDLISRTFNVQPSFVAPPPDNTTPNPNAGGAAGRPINPNLAPAATTEGGGDTVLAALEAKGVKFPPGASAVYTPTTGQLTVVDTADQMDLLEELVNAGQAPTLMIRIAAKFVEINQQDLNDLTINTAFNFFTFNSGLGGAATSGLTPNGSIIRTTSFNTALEGSLGIAPDSLDTLISPQTGAFNTLAMRGFFNAHQYNVVLNALSQKKSADLLEDPSALVKSGEQAKLDAVRSFPYPTAFDPPELVSQSSNTGNALVVVVNPPIVIATTPTDFKRRDVGVELVIRPQLASDDQTIDLSLFPQVTQFDGFINYGSVINIPNPDGTSSLLSTNELNQPVFDTRRVNTKVLIHDGSTVVLGGLINDNQQTVEDDVPVLSKIPLLGRLFRSKAVENTKRNLIIFVTANIYQNDGSLLNPPVIANAADVLTGHSTIVQPVGTP
jgi:general secretion pathway protein D